MSESDSGDTTLTFHLESPSDDTAPCLVMIRGPQLGLRIPLANGETTLGRDPRCSVVVPLGGVSRLHCAFTLSGGRVALRDLGSGASRCSRSREPWDSVRTAGLKSARTG